MGETRLSIAFFWDGGGRQGDSGALYGGYTNLAYWTFNDDVNDVDVDREAPCTLFSKDRGRGSGNGHWFDAKRVGQRYHSTDLGTMNDRTESLARGARIQMHGVGG